MQIKSSYLFLAAIFIFSWACASKNNIQDNQSMSEYHDLWAKVDSLEQKGFIRSALKEVETIYEISKQKNDLDQTIKSLIYQNKFVIQVEEEGPANTLLRLEQEVDKESSPVKEFMHSMLGELYYWYIQHNHYRLSNRTDIVGEDPEDLKTWSLEKLIRRSNEHYFISVSNPANAGVTLSDLKATLTKYDDESSLYVDNVYEFLLYRAGQHFANVQSFSGEPIHQFYLEDEEAFGPVEQFINHSFNSKDNDSGIYNALLVYQQALAHFSQKNAPRALIYANLQRLQFTHQHSVHPDKDRLYETALDHLIQESESSPELAEAYYYKAELLRNKEGKIPRAEKLDLNELNLEIEKLCLQTIEDFPNTNGAIKCEQLLSSLRNKYLQVQLEQVNLPNKPLRFLVSFKNLDQLYFRIIPVDQKNLENLNEQRYDAKVKFLQRLDPILSWSQELPNKKDYQVRNAELFSPVLKEGNYLLIAADNPQFSDRENAISFSTFYVSNLAYSFLNEQTKASILVTSRDRGEPLQNVKVEFYERKYNSRTRRNEFKLFDTKSTDRRGYASTSKSVRNSIVVALKHRNDVLDLKWNHYFSSYNPQRNESKIVHLFTDRAIYRPGQNIHFKGILLKLDKKGIPSIQNNDRVKVQFLDVNRQLIEEKEFVSNEYGSISGIFTAPTGRLLGQMSLRAIGPNGNHTIRVEEYKRPKFEVEIDTIDTSPVLGEVLNMTAKAKNYAGNPIDQGTAQYRVIRETYRPYFFNREFYYRPYIEQSKEIAFGTAELMNDGSISFNFIAADDPGSHKNASFHFKVLLDVTDGTGETNSTEFTFMLGKKAFQFSTNLQTEIDAKNFDRLKISTNNLSQIGIRTDLTVTLNKLNDPTLHTKRYWTHPDTILLKEESFQTHFSDYVYAKPSERDPGLQLQQFSWSNKSEEEFELQNLNAGLYRLEMKGIDQNGNEVEEEIEFTVFDFESSGFPVGKSHYIKLDKEKYRAGEKVLMNIGVPFKDQKVWFEIEKAGTIYQTGWLETNRSSELNIPVSANDYGNFFVNFYWNRNNRPFSHQEVVQVPWDHKKLTIEFETFRDLLKPGQEETWKLRLKGPGGEKVAAELLASMYDASLDKFAANNWSKSFYPLQYSRFRRQEVGYRSIAAQLMARDWNTRPPHLKPMVFPAINYFNLAQYFYQGGYDVVYERGEPMMNMDEVRVRKSDASTFNEESAGIQAQQNEGPPTTEESISEAEKFDFSPRVNLKETVFFYPDLETDAEGNVVLNFTMNEALTKWKLLLFSHSKDFKYGFSEKEIITQKDLMVFPNAPRFLREGDRIKFPAKVVNLSNKNLNAKVQITLLNTLNSKELTNDISTSNKTQEIYLEAGSSETVIWDLNIPYGTISQLTYQVKAITDLHTDGEENVLPVLTNRMLVTESLPLAVPGKISKEFILNSLKNNTSKTLKHQSFTIEFTSNPAWYAVLALPYLTQYPYECSEQIFNRFYANVLAHKVVSDHPVIEQTFQKWASSSKDVFLSQLSKNEELKSVLLQETPWVLNAMSEEMQRKNIALLFDLNKMKHELSSALQKLSKKQLPNGGFPWFDGGKDNIYISQYILEGMGHLEKLGISLERYDPAIQDIKTRLIDYVDLRMGERYEELLQYAKYHKIDLEKDHLDALSIHYLYARSFFDQPIRDDSATKANEYYLKQAHKYWPGKGHYLEGMISLILFRNEQPAVSNEILSSLAERAIVHEELGMYWKGNRGYGWQDHRLEAHALMIEAFNEITQNQMVIDQLKIWLLKNKQTNHWKTTKATAAAVHAMLITPADQGYTWLRSEETVKINIGNNPVVSSPENYVPGLEYIKESWKPEEISNQLSRIQVTNPNDHIGWGAAYWQYFEDLDKIEAFEETPLTLKKQLFISENSDRGPVLRPITEEDPVAIGDKIVVRIELRVDRGMEFIHMKDMRSSGFEPLNVLSRYKWQGGLGYYESTGDVATNFFMDYLPIGTHVFEYSLRAVHEGSFSNGITSIQCMYAPEFSSHSQGIQVEIERGTLQ